jgi:hypothetical protein
MGGTIGSTVSRSQHLELEVWFQELGGGCFVRGIGGSGSRGDTRVVSGMHLHSHKCKLAQQKVDFRASVMFQLVVQLGSIHIYIHMV